jgi:hypothetical protein
MMLIGIGPLALGGVLLVPTVIRSVAHSGLAALGFRDAHGGSVSLDLHRIRIVDVAIGHKSKATVVVSFQPGRLVRGQLDSIDVTNTVLHAVVALDGTPELDGYTAPAPRPASTKPIALPADRVTIADATLALETALGTSTATISGTLVPTDDGLHLTGNASLTGAALKVTTPVDFTLSPSGWSLSLNPIRVAFPTTTDAANAAEGHLNLTGNTTVAGDGALNGENLVIQSIQIRKLGLSFKTGPDGLSGTFQLAPKANGAGIDASLKSDGTGITATLKAGFTEIGAIGKLVGGEIKGPAKADLSLHIDPAANPRPVTMNLSYDGIVPGGIVLRNAKLREAAAFDATQNALTLTSCGAFSSDGVTLAGFTLAKLSGCLGPMPGRAVFDQDPNGKVALGGTVTNLAAAIVSGSDTLAEAAIPTLNAAVDTTDGQVTGFAVGLSGGTVTLPVLGSGLRDLAVKAGNGEGGAVTGTITASFAAAAPKSPALPIAGSLGGSIRNGISVALTAGSPNQLPIVKASVTGQTAKLDMAATELGQGKADLLQLMPGLATSISKLSGSLAVSLAAEWSGPTMSSHGSITLKDVGGTIPSFTFEGLDSVVTLTSLVPLATADNQVLTMKRLQVSVPLTDGRVTFGLNKHRMLKVADAHWSVAGGTIGTYDQELDLYGPDQNLGVVVKNVDLAQLLMLANVSGLTAEGIVDGAIPLRRTKDIIRVEHGVLQTRAAGTIRYDPADPPSFLQGQPGQGTAILRDALKDFHYQQLGLTIDGVLGGEEQIKLKLNGANPTLYGGIPVALNVNLTGALDSIARSSVEAYTNPTKTVNRKLQKKPGDKK